MTLVIRRVLSAAPFAFVAAFVFACLPAEPDAGDEGDACVTNPFPTAPVAVETDIVTAFDGNCPLLSLTESEGQLEAYFECIEGLDVVVTLTLVAAPGALPDLVVDEVYMVEVTVDPEFAQLDVLISDAQGPLVGVVENREQVSWGPLSLSYATACEATDTEGVDGFVHVEHGDEATDVVVGTPAQIDIGELGWDVYAIRAHADIEGDGPAIHAVLIRR